MALLLKTVAPARGIRWVRDGFALFARRPMAFASLFVLFLAAALFSSLIPYLGGLLQMMSLPLLSLGFMVAGQSALLDGPVKPAQFIEPLRGDAARRRSLFILCAIYGVSALLILLATFLYRRGPTAGLELRAAQHLGRLVGRRARRPVSGPAIPGGDAAREHDQQQCGPHDPSTASFAKFSISSASPGARSRKRMPMP